jgi:hypothetical protein
MGVWERSPKAREIALHHESFQEKFRRALPDFQPDDVVGSPFSVRRYRVDDRLGGPEGLASVRRRLAERGTQLVLDFVPNHVAPDHDWMVEAPEIFIPGSLHDHLERGEDFFVLHGEVFAHGRDPYFPPWTDTVQINAFAPKARSLQAEALLEIAEQCDGVRCDMAMLMTSDVFARTWGERAGAPLPDEYWEHLTRHVKKRYPAFVFIGEVYWDMEWELQQQGFDYCYDKRLYDRVAHDSAESIRAHLTADLSYQNKLIRFIENHDEPRACVAMGPDRSRAAALLVATLPGAKLIHEGQMQGHRIEVPVQLGRRPYEPDDPSMVGVYRELMDATSGSNLCRGEWRLLETGATISNLIVSRWKLDAELHVILVNFGPTPIRETVRISGNSTYGLKTEWKLRDSEVRKKDEPGSSEIVLSMDPWAGRILRVAL